MHKTIKRTVRLSETQESALAEITVAEAHTSVSETIRIAIENFIMDRVQPIWGAELKVRLPPDTMRKLKRLLRSGKVMDIGEAVRTAVAEYTDRKLNAFIGEQKLFEAVDARIKELERIEQPKDILKG